MNTNTTPAIAGESGVEGRAGVSPVEQGVPPGVAAEKGPLDPKDEGTFPPPDAPIMVYCMHCGKEYMSSEMIFRRGTEGEPGASVQCSMWRGFWYCPTDRCTAGGFGLDVFPVDPDWKDPKGLLEFIPDADDEEFDWGEVDDEDEID